MNFATDETARQSIFAKDKYGRTAIYAKDRETVMGILSMLDDEDKKALIYSKDNEGKTVLDGCKWQLREELIRIAQGR